MLDSIIIDEGQVWECRGKALLKALATYGTSLNARTFPSTQSVDQPPKSLLLEKERDFENLRVLRNALQEFAEKQVYFFQDGFFTQREYCLKHSTEFPPAYVMSVILNQIAEDLELIRRVVDQRQSDALREALRRADQLIARALKPALGSCFQEAEEEPVQPVSLGYFQKAAAIRIVPYAQVALIGIPFTAIGVYRDYLAIPHEVGHFVYRNGRISGEPIPQMLGRILLAPKPILGSVPVEPSPRYVRRWKEEIFADVYGCMVGGPVVALSFRDLSRQTSRTPILQTPAELLYGQFTEDDGVHPVPALRPYVYTRVLMKNGWNEVADRLNTEWQEELMKNRVTEFRTRYLGPGVDYIGLNDGKKVLEAAVDQVYKLIKDSGLGTPDWSFHSNRNPMSLSKLYSDFDGFVEKLNNPPDPMGTLPPKIQNICWEEWVRREKFFPGLKKGQPPKKDTPIEPGKAQRVEELEQEPRYTWNHLFLAGGWATRVGGAHGTGVVMPKNWRGGSGGGGSGGY